MTTNRTLPLRVCAVSYLNTVPLSWGLLHSPPPLPLELDFAIPAECSRRLEQRKADIGLVPAIEVPRLGLRVIPGAGIACEGPVRSILLVSSRPFPQIRSLAADSSSRTSVMLARLLLERVYGVRPAVERRPPDLTAMLAEADAALLIGDSALRVDPCTAPGRVLDLGELWTKHTGLPMVFAVWAARPEVPADGLEAVFRSSLAAGQQHLDEIVDRESAARGFPPALTRHYLTHNIRYHINQRERQGLELFWEYAHAWETASH